ncbi:MAG: zinc metalloprotease HtpX [Candidatus Yanofskybacteria bacterium RIFCSPHIGHO2_01_FULL_44_17]|uniref:Protease HtpX homolog n=1 Tax=Candidatus Yanofskybacteria bacterium RIFCSPHIGHO2_01_FULL_44_17 TaxID=1802668 RepID=A0A1F8EWM3_9BACT|nr:MAG: zinc metalloprotease HtpX [Candidatus Yanofskybacteria bacterium RIFCSPHIGHO2_01_FULL_44_17]
MINLYTQQSANVRKTWLLITVFLVLIVGLGWLISYAMRAPEILYLAVGLAFIMNLVAYWNSDKIALSMSAAKPVKREQNLYLHRMIENLAITAGLPTPRIYLIDSPQINAFATGRDPKHAAIAVTTGALSKLQNEELEGVLAHELSHIGNRDILVSTIVVVLAGVIAIVSDWALRVSFFGGHRDDDNRGGGGLVLLISLAAAILAPLASMLIQMAVSRKREYLADASGALLTRYPDGLANALAKIGQDSSYMPHAHNATAHLFISSPFKGKEGTSWLSRLFMTHPPLEDRIRILRGMKA